LGAHFGPKFRFEIVFEFRFELGFTQTSVKSSSLASTRSNMAAREQAALQPPAAGGGGPGAALGEAEVLERWLQAGPSPLRLELRATFAANGFTSLLHLLEGRLTSDNLKEVRRADALPLQPSPRQSRSAALRGGP
jgi:hypothetical protein